MSGPSAEANSVRAGFQEFIAKPISDYSALKSRLAHWLTPRDARGHAITPDSSPTCAACRGGEERDGRRVTACERSLSVVANDSTEGWPSG